ncbi:MAG TPA: DUF3592 domain-containing protein [Acidimicrobiales bacterium]|nr:DUF3592 domain-containing protein [Acidimicrobiales bacterium]
MAIEYPGVKDELRRYRWAAVALALLGLPLLAAVALVFHRFDAQARELRRSGDRVTGQVVTYWIGLGTFAQDSITVQFEYKGQARSARVSIMERGTEKFRVGQPVTVYVDPKNPERLTVEGEQNLPRWALVLLACLIVTGAACPLAGGAALARAREQRRLLSTNTWQRSPLTCVRNGRGGTKISTRPLIMISDGHHMHLLGAAHMRRNRLPGTGLLSAAEVDFVGVPSRYVVLRAVGSEKLVSAYPPRTGRTRHSWQKEFARRAAIDLRHRPVRPSPVRTPSGTGW